MKAHLINMHLLVSRSRSRSSAKVKVKYQGYIAKKSPFWGDSCFTNTSCFYIINVKKFSLRVIMYFTEIVIHVKLVYTGNYFEPLYCVLKRSMALYFRISTVTTSILGGQGQDDTFSRPKNCIAQLR